jgi:hypothetical protein
MRRLTACIFTEPIVGFAAVTAEPACVTSFGQPGFYLSDVFPQVIDNRLDHPL